MGSGAKKNTPVSNLLNDHVARPFQYIVEMSPVEFKK